jgi:hypothetical protein
VITTPLSIRAPALDHRAHAAVSTVPSYYYITYTPYRDPHFLAPCKTFFDIHSRSHTGKAEALRAAARIEEARTACLGTAARVEECGGEYSAVDALGRVVTGLVSEMMMAHENKGPKGLGQAGLDLESAEAGV